MGVILNKQPVLGNWHWPTHHKLFHVLKDGTIYENNIIVVIRVDEIHYNPVPKEFIKKHGEIVYQIRVKSKPKK